MSQDLDDRLKKAVAERDKLVADAQRIAGRKEAAEKALSVVEKEIREKNLDPNTLDETIVKLEDALRQDVSAFEEQVSSASEALAPFLEIPS